VSIDEVFLLVARGDTVEEQKPHLASSRIGMGGGHVEQWTDEQSVRSRMDLENEGLSLFFVHLGALFKKRAANFRRDKKAWVCTTILPSIFVLIGFIVFTVITARRDLHPIVLDLNDLNAGVTSTIKNPIPFNSPDRPYTCQPGSCAYEQESVYSQGYAFCGIPGNLQYSCTIEESSKIMDTILGFEGSAPVETNASSVSEVSDNIESRNFCSAFLSLTSLFQIFLVLGNAA